MRHRIPTERVFIVYECVFPNNMKYIGVTSRGLKERVKDHNNCKRNDPFHNALRKHRQEVYWNIISTFTDSNEAYKHEQELIKSENTIYPKGYNYTLGGEYAVGYKLGPRSEEYKRWLSEHHKSTGYSVGEKNPFYGKKHSEETKELIRQKNKKFKVIDEFGVEFDSVRDLCEKRKLYYNNSIYKRIKSNKPIKGVLYALVSSV